jgi:amino acid adenylation domain-containing protein
MCAAVEHEDFYPLSPMQEGMLFHTLYAARSGVYVTQVSHVLHGELDVEAFERTWQQLFDRHAILRTFFVWEKVAKRVQVVQRHTKASIETQDWQSLTIIQKADQLREWLKADRTSGFNLAKAPLVRLALMRLEKNSYQFIFSFHHLLLDGWSIPILMQEALAIYEALRTGREAKLPPRRPFREYISWLQRQDLAQAESYWRQVLKGFSAPTPLPVDHTVARELPQSNFGEHERFLSAHTSARLDSFTRRQRLTLNTLTQGAWALLLSRYSDEEDILFGATVSGRPSDLAGADGMVGLFINTLPVRVRVAADANVLSWLKEFQHQQLEARQYEYTPLLRIHGWSELRREVPLFESIFVFENYPQAESIAESSSSLRVSNSRCAEQTNYPLSLMVTPDSQFSLKFFYDCSVFERQTIERMLDHYAVLLEEIEKNPEGKIRELSLLSAAERERLVVEWNDTKSPFPRQQCIHELFEAQAARTPEQMAVVSEQEALSYEDLNARANQFAHYLRRLGVGPDVLVGLMLERSTAMVVALLGVLKAGGAYVPLDPHYPAERLRYMVRDAGLAVLVTEQRWLAGLGVEELPRVLTLENESEQIRQESKSNVRNETDAQNLAYVIYTSGSTGLPKGAMLSHRGLCNLSESQIKIYQLGQDDRVLQFSSLSFDASIFEIVMALRVGATLNLLKAEANLPGPALTQFLRDEKITSVTLPPSVLSVLPAEELSNLKTITVAGEACPSELVRCWSAGRRFFNAYGPTEATVWSSIEQCSNDGNKPSIGRPIFNTQIYVLDQHLKPVPVGIAGELHIAGAGLARGYLNRPDLTALRFIPNPFSTELGARLYKSGDQARYLPDGRIEFLGRIDNQVKVRGFRIELEEIEAVLGGHAGVRGVAVIAREDDAGEKRLVGYVAGEADTAELRLYLAERLPEYMVPGAWVRLEQMPLTSSGKVDRRALPAPDTQRPELSSAFVPPRSAVEREIAEIWQEVLGIENVGVADNFFDLGGHSLHAVRVHSKLCVKFESKISLVHLFQFPTISALADLIDQQTAPEPAFEKVFDRVSKQRDALVQQRQLMKERKKIYG